jgi:hypothetical protein
MDRGSPKINTFIWTQHNITTRITWKVNCANSKRLKQGEDFKYKMRRMTKLFELTILGSKGGVRPRLDRQVLIRCP